jgi:hypothetical protein
MNDRIVISEVALSYFSDLKSSFSERTLKAKLPGEIGAVLQSYVQSSLSRLNLLRKEQTGIYHKETPVDIPPLAFLYQLLHFRECTPFPQAPYPSKRLKRERTAPVWR